MLFRSGRKVWFDPDVLRLNYDARGRYLGEFQSDETILVVHTNGDFHTTDFDLNNHYDPDILLLEKYDPDKVWTAVLFDADQQNYPYLKRFPLESSARRQNYLGENRQSRPVLLSGEAFPRIRVSFGGNDAFREPLLIEAADFVGVKSFKAKGKRLTTFTVDQIEELEPLRTPEAEPEASEETSGAETLSATDGENGQMNLFADDDPKV